MMRFCPKCGDYYADASLGFCLVDGTPLVSVNPNSENWSEGARVIEEKANELRRQTRKLKWRRVVLRAMAMVTMVVCVVAVNSWVYLRPQPEEFVPAEPLTPTTAKPDNPVAPGTPGKAIPTSTRRPTRTPETKASPITTETTRPPRDTKPPGTPTQTTNLSPTHTQTPTLGNVRPDTGKPRDLKSIIERFRNKLGRKIIKRPG